MMWRSGLETEEKCPMCLGEGELVDGWLWQCQDCGFIIDYDVQIQHIPVILDLLEELLEGWSGTSTNS